jgi:hypothetical protein
MAQKPSPAWEAARHGGIYETKFKLHELIIDMSEAGIFKPAGRSAMTVRTVLDYYCQVVGVKEIPDSGFHLGYVPDWATTVRKVGDKCAISRDAVSTANTWLKDHGFIQIEYLWYVVLESTKRGSKTRQRIKSIYLDYDAMLESLSVQRTTDTGGSGTLCRGGSGTLRPTLSAERTALSVQASVFNGVDQGVLEEPRHSGDNPPPHSGAATGISPANPHTVVSGERTPDTGDIAVILEHGWFVRRRGRGHPRHGQTVEWWDADRVAAAEGKSPAPAPDRTVLTLKAPDNSAQGRTEPAQTGPKPRRLDKENTLALGAGEDF